MTEFRFSHLGPPPTGPSDEGHVYVVAAGNRVKIGWSEVVTERLQTLQSASPIPLMVYALIPAQRALEGQLHKRFAVYRVSGKWFELKGSLLTWVVSRCAMDRHAQPQAAPGMHALAADPDDLVNTAALSKEFFGSSYTPHRVLLWARNPKYEFPQPIRIGRRHYFRRGDIDAWKRARWKSPMFGAGE